MANLMAVKSSLTAEIDSMTAELESIERRKQEIYEHLDRAVLELEYVRVELSKEALAVIGRGSLPTIDLEVEQ